MSIRVDIANRQHTLPIDRRRLRSAIRAVLADNQVSEAAISIALVDDRAIHDLNRRFLAHDEPTDVLSFCLSEPGEPLEGEIVASTDTAQAAAAQGGWSADDELLLYVIHGALHLVGYDDHDTAGRARMRRHEAQHLARFGLALPPAPADAPQPLATPSRSFEPSPAATRQGRPR